MGQSLTKNFVDAQKEAAMRQRLADIKTQKMQRDAMLSTQIALSRDRVMYAHSRVTSTWMGAFYITMATIGAARAYITKKVAPLPLELVPYVAVPYLFLYQADAGFYTKPERIAKEAKKIREEEYYWFNEPLDLPEQLKPVYRRMMDEQNELLRAAGKPPEKEWAR